MSDDEIEIVESADKSPSGSKDICQLCSTNLYGLSVTERSNHYSLNHGHIVDLQTRSRPKRRRSEPNPASVISSQRKPLQMKCRKNTNNAAQEDVFWYPAQSRAPPDNYSPGVLSILKEALKKSYTKGTTRRAVLCYERTPHILRESFDMKWGCGYRNFLMTCAALMDQQLQTVYFPHLDSPSPPGVRNLQHWMEDAWELGYDEVGARELDHKLVDTNKQIGTGDLYTAFTSRKIPCILVDFDLRKSPKGFRMLTEWVVNYFTEKLEGNVNQVLRASSPIVTTNKMPVIMQFDGHSVTIVGYEIEKGDKCNLLVFDPSSKVLQEIRQAALSTMTSVDWASPGKSKPHERLKSPPRKRSRPNQDSDDGVVSIPDSDGEQTDDARRAASLKSTLDPQKVVRTFRLTNPKYKKKQDYQLLYFTMGDPLSDQEQSDRKVVLADC